MHNGHRKRMREKMLAGGEFPPHELLEVLLGFAIPRINTNELAHRLLEHFGSLDDVLEAPYEELMEIHGMGEHSAFLFGLIDRICRARGGGSRTDGIYLDSEEHIRDYIEKLFCGMRHEAAYVALLDSRSQLNDCVCIGEGSSSFAQIGLERLLTSSAIKRSAGAVLMHNHPDGSRAFSLADRDFSARVTSYLATQEIEVRGIFLWTGDEAIRLNAHELTGRRR